MLSPPSSSSANGPEENGKQLGAGGMLAIIREIHKLQAIIRIGQMRQQQQRQEQEQQHQRQLQDRDVERLPSTREDEFLPLLPRLPLPPELAGLSTPPREELAAKKGAKDVMIRGEDEDEDEIMADVHSGKILDDRLPVKLPTLPSPPPLRRGPSAVSPPSLNASSASSSSPASPPFPLPPPPQVLLEVSGERRSSEIFT